MSPLRKQMQADMAVRGLAVRTQKAYIDAVAAIAPPIEHALWQNRSAQIGLPRFLQCTAQP
ncbi:hypothetical protein GCM10027343_24010 [Noviherbaspirillum agri]